MLIAVAKWGITINTLFYVKCLLFVQPSRTRVRERTVRLRVLGQLPVLQLIVLSL